MPARSTGSRIYLTIIGVMLATAGSVFSWLMWRSFQRARAVDHWPEVPCVILLSEEEERKEDPAGPVERRFSVLYGYHWEEVPRESDLLQLRGSPWTGKEDVVQAYLDRYPEGSVHQCRVNPEDPDIAVLEAESKAPGYSLWFPLLFVAGGAGMVVGAWRN